MNFKITLVIFWLSIGFANMICSQTNVALESMDIRAVFVDNSAYGEYHLKGFNGVSELYHKSQDSTLFVPLFSGINLEHIFDGDSLVSVKEPRKELMTIKKLSDSKVMLHQPLTSISNVENWTVFEMVDPHYIDVDFSFIVHDPGMFNNGYVGFFWASYINLPKELGIYFKGKKDDNGARKWMYVYSKKHGEKGTILGENDPMNFYMAPNFNIDLATEFSEYKFSEPYYFGRFHNMVFAYLFPKPDQGVIRFAHSPSGAGHRMPAWDFQYILPNFEVGKKYSLKWRVMYKEWVNQKDIENEYKTWSKLLDGN